MLSPQTTSPPRKSSLKSTSSLLSASPSSESISESKSIHAPAIRLSSLPMDGPLPLWDPLAQVYFFIHPSQWVLVREIDSLVIALPNAGTHAKEYYLPHGLSFDKAIDRLSHLVFPSLSDEKHNIYATFQYATNEGEWRIAFQKRRLFHVFPSWDALSSLNPSVVVQLNVLLNSEQDPLEWQDQQASTDYALVGTASKDDLNSCHIMMLGGGLVQFKLTGWGMEQVMMVAEGQDLQDISLEESIPVKEPSGVARTFKKIFSTKQHSDAVIRPHSPSSFK